MRAPVAAWSETASFHAEAPLPAALPREEPTAAATSRPQLPPRGAAAVAPDGGVEATRASSVEAERKPVVGIVILSGARPGATEWAQAAAIGKAVVFSVPKDGDAAAPPHGVYVAESAPGSGPGRLRNAGYRVLKKEVPDVDFVQFLEDRAILDPAWLDAASRFLQRRPEVAVVAGRTSATDIHAMRDGGEIKYVGRNFLIRAEAFETAGGFRGDLTVNESADLSVRLRRRGAHIWMLSDRMTTSEQPPAKSWWGRARDDGYAYAHGARLHGAPPERLFLREHLSGIAWGAVAPALIIMTSAGLGALFLLRGSPLGAVVASTAALLIGVLAYLARIVVVGIRRGGDAAAWRFAVQDTAGQFARVLGACRFYLSGVDPRRNAS